jgi:hypothetical protein
MRLARTAAQHQSLLHFFGEGQELCQTGVVFYSRNPGDLLAKQDNCHVAVPLSLANRGAAPAPSW